MKSFITVSAEQGFTAVVNWKTESKHCVSCLNCFSEVSVSLSLLKDKLKTTLDEVNYYFNCITEIHLIINGH